jgi:hypothetical protein
MVGSKPLFLALAIVAATTIAGPPARGQCRLCDEPTTLPRAEGPSGGDVEVRVESSLNFDRLLIAGPGSGAATLRPNGSSGAEGSVSQLGPRATVGMVTVHGDPDRAVRADLPRRIELFAMNGAKLTLEDVTTDLPPNPRLDAAGNLTFRFGGRLVVSGDADGPYRGDLPITVEYP